MYQLEVKKWLVFDRFPAEEGWDVVEAVRKLQGRPKIVPQRLIAGLQRRRFAARVNVCLQQDKGR